MELSDLEIKVLQLVSKNSRPMIKLKLWLTQRWMARIFKKLKELWYTVIFWQWWTYSDWDYEYPEYFTGVSRHTVVSEKWLELIKKIK